MSRRISKLTSEGEQKGNISSTGRTRDGIVVTLKLQQLPHTVPPCEGRFHISAVCETHN